MNTKLKEFTFDLTAEISNPIVRVIAETQKEAWEELEKTSEFQRTKESSNWLRLQYDCIGVEEVSDE